MSNLQTTSSNVPAEQPQNDPTLRARRLMAVVISIILGVIVCAVIITGVLKTDLMATEPISNWDLPVIVLASIPLSLLMLIWVDYFLKTKILPD